MSARASPIALCRNCKSYMWPEMNYRDRAIACFLALGGVAIGYSLLYGAHGLWKLPVVSNVIFPGGSIIVAFWFGAFTGRLPNQAVEVGWWISGIWHLGWLLYLIVSIFGFLGMLVAAPFLLGWLILAAFLSVAAGYDFRQRIKDAQQAAPSNGG